MMRCKLRWLGFAVLCVALYVIAGQGLVIAQTADEQPVVEVRGPTVVAFFPPVTNAELEKDPDLNETLADFQLYASRVRKPLGKAGIEFQELYVHSFQVRDGENEITFQPSGANVGYYFIAPGKAGRVEYGVQTDLDIEQQAREYFGVALH